LRQGACESHQDGIIDPAQARRTLGLPLSAMLDPPIPQTCFDVFRM